MERTRTSTRRVWVAAAIAVATVVALIWWLVPRPQSAHDAALSLFEALAAGDTDAVSAAGVTVSDAAAAAFSTASALPAQPRVQAVAAAGDDATVTISYQLGEDAFTAEISMERHEGGWRASSDDVLGTLTPRAEWSDAAAVGDVALPLDEETALLPGVYTLRAGPSDLFAASTVTVSPGSAQEAVLAPDFAVGGLAILQAQLEGYLDDCTRASSAVPDRCGIRIPWAADMGSAEDIRYRAEQHPVLAVDLPTFRASGGVLVATVDGLADDGEAVSVTYRSTDWGVRGSVVVTLDEVRLEVW